MAEVGMAEVGIAEVGIAEVGVNKAGVGEIGSTTSQVAVHKKPASGQRGRGPDDAA